MNYELIKNKYGKCSSWAIWKKRVLGDKEKDFQKRTYIVLTKLKKIIGRAIQYSIQV